MGLGLTWVVWWQTGSGTGSNFFSASLSTMALQSETNSEPHTPRNVEPSPPPLEAIHSGLPLDTMSDTSSREGHFPPGERLGCDMGCLAHKVTPLGASGRRWRLRQTLGFGATATALT